MKICMVSGSFPPHICGVGDYTWFLSRELVRLGHDMNMVTSSGTRPLEEGEPGKSYAVSDWGYPELFKILSRIQTLNPDVIHLQYPTQAYKNKTMINWLPAFLKMRCPKTPVFLTVHDAKTAHFLNQLRLVPMLQAADHVLVPIQEEKEFIESRWHFTQGKVSVLPIGSNIPVVPLKDEERTAVRQSLGIPLEGFLIIHFGLMLPKKGLESLFLMLKGLRDSGRKVYLLMLGNFDSRHGSFEQKIKNQIKTLGLAPFVIWKDHVVPEEVSRMLQASDVSVQMYQDGLSFRRGSLLAVLSHGVPVVTNASPRGTLPAGVQDGTHVLLVPWQNPEAMKEAVMKLIHSPELQNNLGKQGALLVRDFTWEAIAEEQVHLYEKRCAFLCRGDS